MKVIPAGYSCFEGLVWRLPTSASPLGVTLAFADQFEPVTVRTTSNVTLPPSLPSLPPSRFYSRISLKVRFRENGGRVATVQLLPFSFFMLSTPQASIEGLKNLISPVVQRSVPGLDFSCPNDRFSRLAVMLHAGHRMNDPRAFIGIKLDLSCTGVRPTSSSSTSHITIDYNVRPHTSTVSIKFRFAHYSRLVFITHSFSDIGQLYDGTWEAFLCMFSIRLPRCLIILFDRFSLFSCQELS